MTTASAITDLSTKFADLSRRFEESLLVISKQATIISEQAAVIISQDAKICALEAALTLKSVVKTSSNSHLSPSSDLSRKNQSLREKSDKPVGGQIGHTGHTLEMTDSPDEIKDLYPSFCNNCGASLLAQPSMRVHRMEWYG